MATPQEPLAPVESVLLHGTFAPNGQMLHRDNAWHQVFGEGDEWHRLSSVDREAVRGSLDEAAGGSLVTHLLVSVHLPHRREPLPVLLNFLPVCLDPQHRRADAVTVTGEPLAEPMSWTLSQTRRHRLETVGQMTMGIAHDFNNLLAGILGHVELMKAHPHFEASPTDVQEHLDTLERAALDGAALVGKIQRYLRQEREHRFSPVDLVEVLRDATSLTRPYWQNEPRRRGITIRLLDRVVPVPRVLGAASELREVFINLILNAVQAMPQGGSLRITTATEGGRVIVQVKDTGVGMTPDVQARIFEPLFTTKGEMGNGMGLAVTYGILQTHDATIELSSAPGEGTVFTLTFPALPDTPPEEAAAPEKVHAAPLHLLIVDDEQMVRNVIAKLLQLRGHSIVQAGSGAEALELVRTGLRFDAVITDLGMPEMNGRQLARRLREILPRVPILLLTGDTEAGAPDEDVHAVLGKPFRIEQVESVLHALAERG